MESLLLFSSLSSLSRRANFYSSIISSVFYFIRCFDSQCVSSGEKEKLNTFLSPAYLCGRKLLWLRFSSPAAADATAASFLSFALFSLFKTLICYREREHVENLFSDISSASVVFNLSRKKSSPF